MPGRSDFTIVYGAQKVNRFLYMVDVEIEERIRYNYNKSDKKFTKYKTHTIHTIHTMSTLLVMRTIRKIHIMHTIHAMRTIHTMHKKYTIQIMSGISQTAAGRLA